jgi:hypothetical protein
MSKASDKEKMDALAVNYIASQSQILSDKELNAANKGMVLKAARENLFLEKFKKIASDVFKNKLQVSAPLPKKVGAKQRILNVILSDQHYEAALLADEVNSTYSSIEQSRRTARVTLEVADYKRQYRKNTVLYVHILGDVIQGQLHDSRDGEPMAWQSAAAIYLLSQQITFLAQEFPEIKVFCTPGNHGRNKSRHHDRAVCQKWDSIENIIYYGVKVACAQFKNVTFSIPKTPYYTYQAFDKFGFMTHGDTVLKPGFPSKSINVESIKKQINEWNASSKEKYSLFAVGHVHTGSICHLPNGTVFMSNGCLIPSDNFALSVGIPETACGMWMWESVPGHIVGDHRFIKVGTDDDKNASLDKVIQPFTSF